MFFLQKCVKINLLSLFKEVKIMLFNFDKYRKKVRGCYVGKCVGGTLGMKYEGTWHYENV